MMIVEEFSALKINSRTSVRPLKCAAWVCKSLKRVFSTLNINKSNNEKKMNSITKKVHQESYLLENVWIIEIEHNYNKNHIINNN